MPRPDSQSIEKVCNYYRLGDVFIQCFVLTESGSTRIHDNNDNKERERKKALPSLLHKLFKRDFLFTENAPWIALALLLAHDSHPLAIDLCE
jgi:hypothetical protein